jgi:hypothetical protein
MMLRLKVIHLLLALAAITFAAKPFFGFAMLEAHVCRKVKNNIAVKIFSKRKPDYLEESLEQQQSLSKKLRNPNPPLLPGILVLLTTLLPALLYLPKITHKFLDDITPQLLPRQPLYLATGKLTI